MLKCIYMHLQCPVEVVALKERVLESRNRSLYEKRRRNCVLKVVAQPDCRMSTIAQLGDDLVTFSEDLTQSYRMKHARIVKRKGFFFNFDRWVYGFKAAGGKSTWKKGHHPCAA